jgi:hypothetical protein
MRKKSLKSDFIQIYRFIFLITAARHELREAISTEGLVCAHAK